MVTEVIVASSTITVAIIESSTIMAVIIEIVAPTIIRASSTSTWWRVISTVCHVSRRDENSTIIHLVKLVKCMKMAK
jgi:hypothetical protein